MTDSEVSEEPNGMRIEIRDKREAISSYINDDNDSPNEVNSVSFDETNLLLLKKYRDWEEALKAQYYKSNPLRNYVSSVYGQSILPLKSSYRNKKKSLPKIFNDLRITQNVQQDRELHRKKLCTSLNINLDSLDVLKKKNPIDTLEESKRIYSEFCKYNLTRPIDITNVESILKVNVLKKANTVHNVNHYEESNQESNFSSQSSSRMSVSSDISSSLHTKEEIILREARKQHQPKRFTRAGDDEESDLLNINARPAKINDLTEINQDRKERKKWLAQSNTDAITLKYNYRTIDSAKLVNQRSTPAQSLPKPTISKQYYQHKGSIFNYRTNRLARHQAKQDLYNYNCNEANNTIESNFQVQAEPILLERPPENPKPSLAKSILVNQNTSLNLNERETTNLDYKLPRVSVNNLSGFGSDFFYESTEHMKNYKANLYYNDSLNNQTLMSQNERRQKRNQHARDKILNDTNEKTNLNKMTILQPFEDTKILINIDKVSSKILNSLLNKQSAVPRYYMPPIKSVGYFKKVITNDPNSIMNAGLAGLNYPATAHMTYADHAARHAAAAKLESLKSLSEMHSKAPTFYYDDESEITNKYAENSMYGLNQSSAIKSEASIKSLDAGGRRSSSKGISI